MNGGVKQGRKRLTPSRRGPFTCVHYINGLSAFSQETARRAREREGDHYQRALVLTVVWLAVGGARFLATSLAVGSLREKKQKWKRWMERGGRAYLVARRPKGVMPLSLDRRHKFAAFLPSSCP